jgi:hypothetical protein
MIKVKLRLNLKDGTTRIVRTRRNGTYGEDGKVFSVDVSDRSIERIDVVVIDDGFGEPVPGKPGLRSYTRKVKIVM